MGCRFETDASSRSFDAPCRMTNHQRVTDAPARKSGTLAAALLALALVWFASFPYRAVMGDDLSLIAGEPPFLNPQTLVGSLTETLSEKYRPIPQALYFLEITAFGGDFRGYLYVNIAVVIVNAWLVTLLAWRLSRRSWVMSFAAGVMLIVSRFAYSSVLLVTGVKDGLCLTFLLALMYALLRWYETDHRRWLLTALVFYLLQVYTHERFLLLAAFLILALALAPSRRSYGRFWLGVPVLIVLSNYLAKTMLLRVEFFRGTGGSGIHLEPTHFLAFMLSGAANIIGFNVGPDYLSGLSIVHAGAVGIWVGVALTVPVALLTVSYWSWLRECEAKECRWAEYRNLALFVVLIASLLATASVTIRQEYRWLYAPYASFIAGVAYMHGRLEDLPWRRTALAVLVLGGALAVDGFYRQHLEDIFFIDGMRVADAARRVIVDRYGSELVRRRVYLVGNGPGRVREFYFDNDRFFRFYTGDPRVSVNYVDRPDEIPAIDAKGSDDPLVFVVGKGSVVDISLETAVRRRMRAAAQAGSAVDFIARFPSGVISSQRHADAPGGRGAFLRAWRTALGERTGLTILSGFFYRFPDVAIGQDEELVFLAMIPHARSDGARAYVDVAAEGAAPVRLTEANVPPPVNGQPEWQVLRSSMKPFAGRHVSISFGVDSPSGDSAADWVVLSDVYLLPPTGSR